MPLKINARISGLHFKFGDWLGTVVMHYILPSICFLMCNLITDKLHAFYSRSYQQSDLWDQLPLELRNIESLIEFKRRLKDHLLWVWTVCAYALAFLSAVSFSGACTLLAMLRCTMAPLSSRSAVIFFVFF